MQRGPALPRSPPPTPRPACDPRVPHSSPCDRLAPRIEPDYRPPVESARQITPHGPGYSGRRHPAPASDEPPGQAAGRALRSLIRTTIGTFVTLLDSCAI